MVPILECNLHFFTIRPFFTKKDGIDSSYFSIDLLRFKFFTIRHPFLFLHNLIDLKNYIIICYGLILWILN